MLLTVVTVAFAGSVFCCRLNHIQELCFLSFSYKTLACVHVLSCQHICWMYIFTGYKKTYFPFNSWLFYLLCTVLKIISWEIFFHMHQHWAIPFNNSQFTSNLQHTANNSSLVFSCTVVKAVSKSSSPSVQRSKVTRTGKFNTNTVYS